MTKLIGLIALAVAAALAWSACGGGGPQERTFTVEVKGGKPVGGEATWRVKQRDTVTFKATSDAPGELHLHGYDLKQDLVPGRTVTLSFKAQATGRFKLEEEKTELTLGYLEVQPR